MEYKLLDRLLPNSKNPDYIQTKIDAFLALTPNLDESAFNEILADIELAGFAKGVSVGIELSKEIQVK